jgi:hypothetical protein
MSTTFSDHVDHSSGLTSRGKVQLTSFISSVGRCVAALLRHDLQAIAGPNQDTGAVDVKAWKSRIQMY